MLAFKSFEKFKELLKEDSKLYLEGTLKVDNDRDQQATVFLNYAMPLSELRETKIRMVEVRLNKDENFDSNLNKLKSIIQKYPGNKVLIIHLTFMEEGKNDERIKVGYGINGAREMVQQLREVLGQTNVWLK